MKKAWLVGLSLLVLACSPAASATKQVKSALAAVQSAESAGAEKDPEAAPSLAQAKSAVARAQDLLKGGNTGEAKSTAASAYQYAEEALKIVRAKMGGSSTAQAAAGTP
jgi:hypothetical protein